MAGIVFSTVLVLSMVFLLLPRTILSVKEGMDGRERSAIAIGEESTVEMAYVHSMYGVRQNEIFSIRQGSVFYLEKVEFGSLAAALYYDADPPSGVAFQGSVWIIKGEGKIYPVLNYRVSSGTGHTLKAGGRSIDLSARSAGGDGLIRIELARRSRISSLFIALRAGMLYVLGS
jgi:hypothetical protein